MCTHLHSKLLRLVRIWDDPSTRPYLLPKWLLYAFVGTPVDFREGRIPPKKMTFVQQLGLFTGSPATIPKHNNTW